MFKAVDRVLVRVAELAPAVRYYRDVLGMTLVRQERRTAAFLLADAATELVLHTDPDLPSGDVFYLVDDVRGLYDRQAELHLKFVSQPRRTSRGYRASFRDAFGQLFHVLDRTQAESAVQEDLATGDALFAGVEPRVRPDKKLLRSLYVQIGRTADDLPYTPEFERLYAQCTAGMKGASPTRAEVWHDLLNLRKAGGLPRLGDARSLQRVLTEEQQTRLKVLLGDSIGRRDRLPYTPAFDELVRGYNASEARPLTPHAIWRLVARVAK